MGNYKKIKQKTSKKIKHKFYIEHNKMKS